MKYNELLNIQSQAYKRIENLKSEDFSNLLKEIIQFSVQNSDDMFLVEESFALFRKWSSYLYRYRDEVYPLSIGIEFRRNKENALILAKELKRKKKQSHHELCETLDGQNDLVLRNPLLAHEIFRGKDSSLNSLFSIFLIEKLEEERPFHRLLFSKVRDYIIARSALSVIEYTQSLRVMDAFGMYANLTGNGFANKFGFVDMVYDTLREKTTYVIPDNQKYPLTNNTENALQAL